MIRQPECLHPFDERGMPYVGGVQPYHWRASMDGATTYFRKLAGCATVFPMLLAIKAISTAAGTRLMAIDDGTNNESVEIGHGAGNTARLFVVIGGVLELHLATTSTFGANPAIIGAYINPGAGVPQIYFDGVNETTVVTAPLVNTPTTTDIVYGARSTGNLMTGSIYRGLVWPNCGVLTTAQANQIMAQLAISQDWSWLGATHLFDFYDHPADVAPTTIVDHGVGANWTLTGVANPPKVYNLSYYG